MNEKPTSAKSLLTVKNILRLLSLLLLIIVFCPTFLVSCSGQKVDVSVMTAVGGVEAYGERVSDPHPIMLICLIIPIVMLVLLFIKKFNGKKTGMILALCGVADFIIWLIFKAAVKGVAEENYCSFETTGWFTVNIFVLIAIIIISALIYLGMLSLDPAIEQGVKPAPKPEPKPEIAYAGYCTNCGTGIKPGAKFCPSCGKAFGGDSQQTTTENTETENADTDKNEAENTETENN